MEASTMNELAKYIIVLLSVTLAYSLLVMIGGRRIFKKANQKEVTVFYPILNLFTMLDITDTSIFLGVLFFVPLINIIVLSIMLYRLAKVFNSSPLYGIGLVLFPIMFYPLLAYSDKIYKSGSRKNDMLMGSNNIMLMTQAELDKLNASLPPEENPAVDSIFKGRVNVAEDVAPYKAVKVDLLGMNKVDNVKASDYVKKKEHTEDKGKDIEYVDL